jgi:hypothetical protein
MSMPEKKVKQEIAEDDKMVLTEQQKERLYQKFIESSKSL